MEEIGITDIIEVWLNELLGDFPIHISKIYGARGTMATGQVVINIYPEEGGEAIVSLSVNEIDLECGATLWKDYDVMGAHERENFEIDVKNPKELEKVGDRIRDHIKEKLEP